MNQRNIDRNMDLEGNGWRRIITNCKSYVFGEDQAMQVVPLLMTINEPKWL